MGVKSNEDGMLNFWIIKTVAQFEIKLLLRSWAFRIFSLLALGILLMMDIGMGTKVGMSPHFFRSLSGSLPLMNIKMLNIYQGIIIVFMATEFIKRDRQHDTTQVVFVRSFSNFDYILGKIIGILSVFSILNMMVLLIVFIIHFFFSTTVFSWQPYIFYPVFISFPTMIFVIGLSFFLVTLLRSQAVVFALMLGYSLLILMYVGRPLFNFFDAFAFYQPLIYSDLIGTGNMTDLLLLRGMYLLIGLGLIAATVLFVRRLRQSRLTGIVAVFLATIAFASAAVCGTIFLSNKYADESYRQEIKRPLAAAVAQPTVTVTTCDIIIDRLGPDFSATCRIQAINQSEEPLDSLLFSLNPGLKVNNLTSDGNKLSHRQDFSLLWIKPAQPLGAGETIELDFDYSGEVDDRYCFLDIPQERYQDLFRMWMYAIPKKYAIVLPEYILLTAESGWYPKAGIPEGGAFPKAGHRDYPNFSLEVTVPENLTAISQGEVEIKPADGGSHYRFVPETRLPQISLTVGLYEKRSVTVDSIDYALYFHPGHDFFTPYMDSLADTIPHLIRELRSEYEVALELDYPHPRLSLVEVPIQFYSYRRLWTTAQEMIQPEIIFLPELGTLCPGADFQRMERGSTRSQERANQAESKAEIQSGYFTNFARIDIMGMVGSMRGITRIESIEPRFAILPNFVSYRANLSSASRPLINYAMETYFKERVAPPDASSRWGWRGLTNNEKSGLLLQEYSLNDLLEQTSLEPITVLNAVDAKSRYLLSYLEATVGNVDFSKAMSEYLIAHDRSEISEAEFAGFIDSIGQVDFLETADQWYAGTLMPGYRLDEVESYQVIDGERTRNQILLTLSNPTTIDGMVELNIRYSKRESDYTPWWMRSQQQSDYSRKLFIPAETTIELGLLIDRPPSLMTIETYVSRNIPSIMRIPFQKSKLKRNKAPYEGVVSRPCAEDKEFGKKVEYLVDNEDAGFTILGMIQENRLRKFLLALFGEEEDDFKYKRFAFWSPPGNWTLTTNQDFYGKFVHSGYAKKTGTGDNKVSWNATIEDRGDYEVYYYHNSEFGTMSWRRHRNRNKIEDKGFKHFKIFHEDGVEEIPLDLNGAQDGWNYLGTFRLAQGNNRVEMTDGGKTNIITADAVKWVLH